MPKPPLEKTVILDIATGVETVFTQGDWRRLGLIADMEQQIEGHHRLFRSMDFGDDDYGAIVLGFVKQIVRGGKLYAFQKFPNLMDWLSEHSPAVHEYVAECSSGEEDEGEEDDDDSVSEALPVTATSVPTPTSAFAPVRRLPPVVPVITPSVPAITPLRVPEAAVSAVNISPRNTSLYDIAVICALKTPELQHLLEASGCVWRAVPADQFDPVTYQHCELVTTRGKTVRIIACAPTQPGMPSSAIAATKMILRFRPKLVAMVGIAAGAKKARQGYGDIIAADVTFDYDSGKIETSDTGAPVFLPDPHPLHIEARLRDRLQHWSASRVVLDSVYAAWRAKKPDTVLKLHVGSLGSGMPVVDNQATVEAVVVHWRKLVGLEMEAYAVHLACRDSVQPPPMFLCMKSICDFAHAKSDDWQDYAAYTAAELFVRFIKDEWEDLHL